MARRAGVGRSADRALLGADGPPRAAFGVSASDRDSSREARSRAQTDLDALQGDSLRKYDMGEAGAGPSGSGAYHPGKSAGRGRVTPRPADEKRVQWVL